MMQVSALWRHPVKGVGAEPLDRVTVAAGACLPGDRAYAIAQQGARTQGEWVPCRSFVRGAKAGSLMAVTARQDDGTWVFSHPALDELTVILPDEGDALIRWIAPLYPENRPAPERLVTAMEQGMTDAPFPSISLLSDASRADLARKAGVGLDRRRFRGNIWLSGTEPWVERQWIGRNIRVGKAVFEVRERNTRCRATHADPQTGHDDIDLLDVLDRCYGHRDFGVYTFCVEGGEIALGDEAILL